MNLPTTRLLPSAMKRTLLTTSIVYIEWVEYALYLYLGTIISQYFFPHALGNNALIFTYGIFAISYIGRPLGGLLFGYYADKKGRRPPLIISAFLIALATIGIGLIPSYQYIGIMAPILLLLCRFIQSIAVAGEFNNASIYLIEHANKHKILAGSWVGTAASAGMFTGGLMAYTISQITYSEAWRLAFIITGIVSLTIMLFRTSLSESPQYTSMLVQKNTRTIFQELSSHKGRLFNIAVIAAFMCLYIYTCNVYFMSYMITKLDYTMREASTYMMLTQAGVTLLIPIMAMITEYIGLKTIMKIMIPSIGLMALILFWGASMSNDTIIIIGLSLYVVANAGISATIFKYMFDALPLHIRCTGNSFIYSLSVAMIGGTAPILAAFLINENYLMAPAYYICVLGILAFVLVSKKEIKEN
ncbi:MFS transporter [uncultured Shewanella sp.]|uniref:MFS transporter n=1 Tax=uncultured Shewanella sp. TaxID=173975 RepID=UPI0026080F24|nr:MFS transporter [uncultured Shewanella sp.]